MAIKAFSFLLIVNYLYWTQNLCLWIFNGSGFKWFERWIPVSQRFSSFWAVLYTLPPHPRILKYLKFQLFFVFLDKLYTCSRYFLLTFRFCKNLERREFFLFFEENLSSPAFHLSFFIGFSYMLFTLCFSRTLQRYSKSCTCSFQKNLDPLFPGDVCHCDVPLRCDDDLSYSFSHSRGSNERTLAHD